MDQPYTQFRQAVGDLATRWHTSGLPSRQCLLEKAAELERLRHALNIHGIWYRSPSMITATLDDGIGQGLEIIEQFAEAIGMRLIRLGLLQTPVTILHACQRHQPDFLGMTVLQFDTEADLHRIAKQVPQRTRIVAGGPVFSADRGFQERTGTDYAASNVADFLRFMLTTHVD
jgi:methylmalonyl-CoA mutase cobalamin-binding subunit